MSTEYDDDDPLANRNRAADLERIKQARKKRIAQLKSWQQYDKSMDKNKVRSVRLPKSKLTARNVHFPQCLILLEAAGRGDIEEVNKILQDGANPDVCNEDGLTALHQCCIDNNLAICRLLLKYGVNINATDSEMWTPLHAAAACAHIDICSCLIDSGAELLSLNAEGNMPYDICEEENTLDLIENAMAMRGISQEDIDEKRRVPELNMLKELQMQNMDLTKLDRQGATCLHIAASCGYIDVGRHLLDNGVSVDILDKDGWYPIHVAACWGQLEFIELLLLCGADINSTTTAGETVYDICEDVEMNQKLLQMKQEIERQHEIKKTMDVKPTVPMLNRRSNSSKRRSSSPDDNAAPPGHLVVGSLRRTASIRRSSMREKSLMSWKEARQEALIREAVQKQIKPDVTDGSGLISDQSRVAGDLVNGSKDEEIDISQVLLNVQIVTDNEIAQREPFIRRGSSRNSFTHPHPYHSPSRDPALLESSLDEESSPIKGKPQPYTPVFGANRISDRNGKNLSQNPSEIISETSKKPQSQNNTAQSHNAESVKSSTRPPINKEKPKKEIDNKVLNKPGKSQGCCVVM